MSIKRILAAAAASVVAVSAMAVAANAETVWEGEKVVDASWNWDAIIVQVEADKFADAKAGDKLVLTFTGSSETQFKINGASDILPGWHAAAGNEWDVISPAESPFEYTLTEDDVFEATTAGLTIYGINYTLTKVELVSDAAAPADEKPADEKPADSTTTAANNVDTGVEGVAAVVGVAAVAAGAMVVAKKRK